MRIIAAIVSILLASQANGGPVEVCQTPGAVCCMAYEPDAPPDPNANPFANIPIGTIAAVNTTNTLSSVSPAEAMGADFDKVRGWTGQKAVVEAWGDVALDTRRKKIVIEGMGGHSDYQGNERYELDLATLTWSRVTMPSVFQPWPSSGVLPDGKPESRHGYYGFEFVQGADEASDGYFLGGTYAGPNAGVGRLFWRQGAGEWGQVSVVNDNWQNTANLIAADALSGRVYIKAPLGLFDATETTSGWEVVRRHSNFWITGNDYTDAYAGMEIDQAARRIVYIGGGVSRVYNITTPGSVTMELNPSWGYNQPSASDLIAFTGPGVDYDSTTQKLVAWIGNGRIFTIDAVQKTITESQAVVQGTLSQPANGVFGRWVYVAAYGSFVGIPRASGPITVYRVH